MSINEYIKKLQLLESYSFSWEELKTHSDKSEKALKSELSRLIKKKEIISIRKGFYIIIPTRYSHKNALPVQLYVHKLFKEISQPYYLGFYSAAKFYGATHQQVHTDYIVTTKPLQNIDKANTSIKFFTVSNFPTNNIIIKRADAGEFYISSPALTILDLLHFQSKIGGFNTIYNIIDELADHTNEKDIQEVLKWYPHHVTIQRLGFILELLNKNTSIIQVLKNFLKSKKYYAAFLDASMPKIESKTNFWKVIPNIVLELDI